jgi:hypothetical protein
MLHRCAHLTGSFQSVMRSCHTVSCRYTFDTTLGVTLAIMLHRVLLRWAMRQLQRRPPPDPEAATGERLGIIYSVAMCGDYGEPPVHLAPVKWALLQVLQTD